jgi:UDP-N-acetylmuramoylalanine--D-glutamate ligase
MNYDLSEFINKDIVIVGKNQEAVSFEAFIKKYAQVKSIQTIEITEENRESYNQQLQSLSPEQAVVVKTAEYPGRFVPNSIQRPTKVFFNCVKQLGAKTIGITGTRGKSTTSSLIYRMLQQGGLPSILVSDIGAQALDALSDANSQSIIVIELTSFQLAELEVSPDIAVITNLSRDHIDYHGNLENYWEAKRNIVRYMTAENSVVFSPAAEMVLHWLANVEAKKIQIDPEEVVDMSKSQLIGVHNKQNYILAKATSQALGVDLFSCQHILKNFKPLPHRLEKVRTVQGITFIDDAIASDPDATVTDVTSCVREVAPVGCVMLGGKDVGYDFTELVKLLSTLLIPKLILFPETADKIKALFPESYEPEIFETSDMHDAVTWALEHCPSGSVCLLSTASPSKPVWKDYIEKGDLFQKAVLGLPISS